MSRRKLQHPVKAAMKKYRHSVQDVADWLGVNRGTVYGWLNGTMPSSTHAVRLAEYCEAEVGPLIADLHIVRDQKKRRAAL
jgi:predicted transcriptional regulator